MAQQTQQPRKEISIPSSVLLTMPVSERMNSIPVRAVVGCPHNKCKFCLLFRGKGVSEFSVPPLEETKRDVLSLKDFYLQNVLPYQGRNPNVFIGDGDAMAMPAQHFLGLLAFLRENMPGLIQVNAYARVRSILDKKDALKALGQALAAFMSALKPGLIPSCSLMTKGLVPRITWQPRIACQRPESLSMQWLFLVLAAQPVQKSMRSQQQECLIRCLLKALL